MKKKYLSLLLLLALCISLFGCGSKSQLVGNWILQDRDALSSDVSNTFVSQLTLQSDGTGLGDGMSLNWSTDKDKMTLALGILGTYSYKYSIKGSILYLDGYAYEKQSD